MKLSLILPGLFCAFLLAASPVFASRNIIISGDKSAIFGDEELAITASASGFTDGEQVYIKGAFFQNGSTNYFGYTQSGDTWIKNSTANLNQRTVKIGEWDGLLSARSDFDDSGFKGEGEYGFKVAFYYLTSGGNISSINWSDNALTVHIRAPDPTPTTGVTPTPTNTPTPLPQPKNTPTPAPTTRVTPTPTKTATPTLKPTPTLVPSAPASAELSSASAAVLGITDSPATASVEADRETWPSVKPLIISLLFVGIGCAILSLVFVWKKRNARILEK